MLELMLKQVIMELYHFKEMLKTIKNKNYNKNTILGAFHVRSPQY